MKQAEKQNSGWTWIIIVIIILGGLYLVSQLQNSDASSQADKVIKAKQACRWDGQRQSWDAQAMATCDKLGTPDYTSSTDHYYEMYNAKLKYGL